MPPQLEEVPRRRATDIEPPKQKMHVKFDPTVNLGHVISLVVFLGAGLSAWQGMDKRVVVLEQAQLNQILTDKRQDGQLDETKKIVREDLKEISGKLDRIAEKIK